MSRSGRYRLPSLCACAGRHGRRAGATLSGRVRTSEAELPRYHHPGAGGGGRADGAAGTELERVGPASGAAGGGGPGMVAFPGPARRYVYCAQGPHGSSRAINTIVLHHAGAGSCRRLDSPPPRS